MSDRTLSAITCGLAFGLLFGTVASPGSRWPASLAAAIVAIQIYRVWRQPWGR
jgi:hypothetical protein